MCTKHIMSQPSATYCMCMTHWSLICPSYGRQALLHFFLKGFIYSFSGEGWGGVRDNFGESGLSFHHMGPRYWFIGFSCWYLHHLHLAEGRRLWAGSTVWEGTRFSSKLSSIKGERFIWSEEKVEWHFPQFVEEKKTMQGQWKAQDHTKWCFNMRKFLTWEKKVWMAFLMLDSIVRKENTARYAWDVRAVIILNYHGGLGEMTSDTGFIIPRDGASSFKEISNSHITYYLEGLQCGFRVIYFVFVYPFTLRYLSHTWMDFFIDLFVVDFNLGGGMLANRNLIS